MAMMFAYLLEFYTLATYMVKSGRCLNGNYHITFMAMTLRDLRLRSQYVPSSPNPHPLLYLSRGQFLLPIFPAVAVARASGVGGTSDLMHSIVHKGENPADNPWEGFYIEKKVCVV